MAPKAAAKRAATPKASPNPKKRAATPPPQESKKARKEEPKAKAKAKGKASPKPKAKAAAKANPVQAAVLEALQMADLPEACRSMLTAALPSCVSTPIGERHEHQVMVVGWIEQAVNGVQASIQAAIEAAKEEEGKFETRKEELKAKLEEAKTAHAGEEEKKAAKEGSVKEANEAKSSAKSNLQTKLADQKREDSNFQEAGKESEKLNNVLEKELSYMRREEGYNTKEALKMMKALEPLARRLGLDESLTVALHSVARKDPSSRGEFDNMVLGELENAIKSKMEVLKAMLEAGSGERAEREAVVAEARKKLEEAEEVHKAAVAALDAQVAELKQAASAMKEADAKLAAEDGEQAKITATKEAKELELTNFVNYNIEHLKTLCKQPEPEPEQPEETEQAEQAAAPMEEEAS